MLIRSDRLQKNQACGKGAKNLLPGRVLPVSGNRGTVFFRDRLSAMVFFLWWNRRFPDHKSKNRTASTGPNSISSASVPRLWISFSVSASLFVHLLPPFNGIQ